MMHRPVINWMGGRQRRARASMNRLLLLLGCWLAAAYCCQPCAPVGCQPLQDAPAHTFAGGACYYLSSSANTPALTLPPTPCAHPSSLNSTCNTWASVPAAQQLPVLDLCNQVQSIWMLQGPRMGGGRLGRGL